jgi:hypothetical protein
MDEWLAFYNPYFENQDEAKKFVGSCETQTYPDNAAKVMMHQVQRLVSLSDDMQKIRPNNEPLKLLILIMCVENIAKLHDGYTRENFSKKYVTKFFNDFLSDTDKDLLRNGFIDCNDKWLRPMSFDNVVRMLYKIRCDVVHEGNYLSFSFYDGKTEMLEMIDQSYAVTPHISLQDVRRIIIHGCISAIRDKL